MSYPVFNLDKGGCTDASSYALPTSSEGEVTSINRERDKSDSLSQVGSQSGHKYKILSPEEQKKNQKKTDEYRDLYHSTDKGEDELKRLYKLLYTQKRLKSMTSNCGEMVAKIVKLQEKHTLMLEVKKTELTDNENLIKSLTSRVDKVTEKCRTLEKKNEFLQEQLKEKETQLKEKETQLKEKETQLKEKETQLKRRDFEIVLIKANSKPKKQNKRKRGSDNSKRNTNAIKFVELNNSLSSQLEVFTSKNGELMDQVENLKRQLEVFTSKNGELMDQVQEKQFEIELIKAKLELKNKKGRKRERDFENLDPALKRNKNNDQGKTEKA